MGKKQGIAGLTNLNNLCQALRIDGYIFARY